LSQEAWEKYGEQYCYEYDYIIVTDTTPIARPFLQMNCPKRIILRITSRFDHLMEKDYSWFRLLLNVQNKNNIRIVPNNYWEEWYARTKGVSFQIFDIIGGLGLTPIYDPDPIHPAAFWECKRYDNPAFLTIIGKWYDRIILWRKFTNDWGMRYNARPDNYCGPKSLTNLSVVHIPYQTSLMGMWENFGEGVVYFIPTPENYISLWETSPVRWGFHGSKAPNKEILPLADWWHQNYTHLFIYWNNVSELRKLSQNYTLINEKRELVYKFIKNYRIQALAQWRRVFLDWKL